MPRARRRRRVDGDDAEQAGVDVRASPRRRDRNEIPRPIRAAWRIAPLEPTVSVSPCSASADEELLVGRARPGVGLAQQPRAAAELRGRRRRRRRRAGRRRALTRTSSLGRNGCARDALVVRRAPAEGDVGARGAAASRGPGRGCRRSSARPHVRMLERERPHERGDERLGGGRHGGDAQHALAGRGGLAAPPGGPSSSSPMTSAAYGANAVARAQSAARRARRARAAACRPRARAP